MPTLQQGTEAGMVWDRASFQFGPDGFRKTVRGTGLNEVAYSLIEIYQAEGWEGSCEAIAGSPKSVFTATIASLDPTFPDNNLVTRWGLDVQWGDVPSLQSQKFLEYVYGIDLGLGGAYWRAIIRAAEDVRKTDDWTKYDALDATAKLWCYDAIAGETCREPDFVLRRSNSYPSNTTQYYDWYDVKKVWTTAQINADSAPPSAILGTLPSTYWLKCSAGAEYASDGKFEVVTHWISGNAQRYPPHRYTYKT